MTLLFACFAPPSNAQPPPSKAIQQLQAEVRTNGWITYSARTENGDWDLFICRPDGSDLRPLTRTPEFNEFSPQFSRDGRRLLYRRIPRSETIDNNHYGEQGALVLALSDGTDPAVLGKPGEYPWASWNPDGTRIASLSIQGISLIDLAGRKTIRSFPRLGFFQQLTWSPDGQWLLGVANSFGASWSIARLNLASGEAAAVNRVDCCTPDWFPDSRQVIFSWRPPGQKTNRGYGWTQLWRADAEGKDRQLVYAEDGRHVYGGHISPDGRYVLFTGNMQEDGDPGKAGAPMGLMRLADAPIIAGASPELRALHPEARDRPVLTLPVGWEPCWTAAEIVSATAASSNSHDEAELAAELHPKGCLVFSAKTGRGDWDLFQMRPDGSDRRSVTGTPEFNEAGARFSPDGTRLLFFRMPKTEPVDNNTYGTFDLVIAQADGSQPVVYGTKFPWASWGPDGTQIACLAPKGIQIVDLATRRVLRQYPRHGIVSQLGWSPDGKRFIGTANGLGPFWNIGCLDPGTGAIRALSETDRYNCTSDWAPDSRHVVYARGIIPEKGGRAQLWVAGLDQGQRHLLYAEQERHIYGACVSPDAKYLLFTRSVEDLGRVDESGTTISIIRWSDTPMVVGSSPTPSQQIPNPRNGPRLDLGQGWEPHWTAKEIAK